MLAATPAVLSLPAHAIEAHDADELAQILQPAYNLVIWNRILPLHIDPVLQKLRRMRSAVQFDWVGLSVEEIFQNLCDAVKETTYRAAVDWLARDIDMLRHQYARLTGVVHPRVRLERVEDGSCVLFHEDQMDLRLLCTYTGPGMQWAANKDARREELGLRGRTARAANAAIVPDPTLIRTVPAGAVALFKGATHPHCEVGALIHRSAPVSGPSEYRIRLCIDDTSACAC